MQSIGPIYLAIMILVYLGLTRISPQKTATSLKVAGSSLLRLIPMLVAIFALIGLIQVFVPPALIQTWLGADASWSSLLAGGLVGSVALGPPVAAFALAGSLLDAGAWPPAIAAFIVCWVSVGVVSLPFEAHVFGARFALARNAITFAAALVIGLLMGMLT